jgi:predicted CoA-binding protein
MEQIRLATIQDFMAEKVFAVAGVSRTEAKMGTAIYKSLKQKGYRVYGIHPSMDVLDGDKVFSVVDAVPSDVTVLVTVLPPAATLGLIQSAYNKGIRKVWMQPGSASSEAIDWCKANGMAVVHNQCIMMFMPGVESIHKLHRNVKKFFGRLPT